MFVSRMPLTLTVDTAGILSTWNRFDCDSDLFVPSDMLRCEGPLMQDGAPVVWPLLKKANRISAMIGPGPVFRGGRTAVENEVDQQSDVITIEAMDAVKPLVDCQPLDRFEAPAGNLAAFAAKLCAPFGTVLKVDANAAIPQTDETRVSPTETIWSILEKLAHQCQCWIWCDALGILHIESLKPYYALPPVAKLMCFPPGPQAQQNNIQKYKLRDDAGERFSHILVQGNNSRRARHGNAADGLTVQPPIEGLAVDPELAALGIYRPLVIADENARSIQQAQNKAIREMMIRRIQGTKIELQAGGHFDDSGRPFAVCTNVIVTIPEKGITGPWFVAGRRFFRDTERGDYTALTVITPGVL